MELFIRNASSVNKSNFIEMVSQSPIEPSRVTTSQNVGHKARPPYIQLQLSCELTVYLMAFIFFFKEKTKHISIQGPAGIDTESSMKLGASVFSAYMLRTGRF